MFTIVNIFHTIYVQLKYDCSTIDMPGCDMITALTYDTYTTGNSQVLKQSHVSTSTFRCIPPHTYQQNHKFLLLGLLSLCRHQMVGFLSQSILLWMFCNPNHEFFTNSNSTSIQFQLQSHTLPSQMSNKFHLLGLSFFCFVLDNSLCFSGEVRGFSLSSTGVGSGASLANLWT